MKKYSLTIVLLLANSMLGLTRVTPQTPEDRLIMMIRGGNPTRALEILKKNPTPNARDSTTGMTALMLAVRGANGNKEMHSVVKALLDAGAEVNAQGDRHKKTALMLTTEPDVAQLLLTHGAKQEITDATGKTALDHAVQASPEVAKILQSYTIKNSANRLAPVVGIPK